MKRMFKNVLAIATIATTVFFASCESNTTTTPPPTNELAGNYTLSATPIFANTEAKDPDADAISFGEGMSLKYSDINTLLMGLSLTETGVTGTVTLNENGTLTMSLTDTETSEAIEFPNEAGNAISYTANSDNETITFTLNSATVDSMLGTATDPETAAAIKMMLANFSSPIFAYNTDANTLAVKLNYIIDQGKFSVFVDLDMLKATVSSIDEETLNAIIAMLPQDDETAATIAQLLPFLMPQIGPMLEGYNTLEIGLFVTAVAE